MRKGKFTTILLTCAMIIGSMFPIINSLAFNQEKVLGGGVSILSSKHHPGCPSGWNPTWGWHEDWGGRKDFYPTEGALYAELRDFEFLNITDVTYNNSGSFYGKVHTNIANHHNEYIDRIIIIFDSYDCALPVTGRANNQDGRETLLNFSANLQTPLDSKSTFRVLVEHYSYYSGSSPRRHYTWSVKYKLGDFIAGGGGSPFPGSDYNPKNPINKSKGSAVGQARGGMDSEGNIALDIDLGIDIPKLDELGRETEKLKETVIRGNNELKQEIADSESRLAQLIIKSKEETIERTNLLDLKLFGVKSIESMNRLMSGKSKRIEIAVVMDDPTLNLEFMQIPKIGQSAIAISTSNQGFNRTSPDQSGTYRTFVFEFQDKSQVPEAFYLVVKDPSRGNIEVGNATVFKPNYYFELVDLD